jgi:hypothetical protein
MFTRYLFNKLLFLFTVPLPLAAGNISHAQELFYRGPHDARLKSDYHRSSSHQEPFPEYMPKPHPSWEGKRTRGNYVKKNSTPIAPLGYGVGRPPSKSAGKEFHPKLSGRRRSMGF